MKGGEFMETVVEGRNVDIVVSSESSTCSYDCSTYQ